MKKLLLSMFVAILAMTSCEKSTLTVDELDGEYATLTVNASAGSVTRSLADASTKELTYYLEVYYGDELYMEQMTNNDGDFVIRLVTEKEFTLVAWADYDEEGTLDYWNTDNGLKNVTINEYAINTTERDAFAGRKNVKMSTNATIDMVLTRPLARINVQTTDLDDIEFDIFKPTHVLLTYSTPIYNTYNVFDSTIVATEITENLETTRTAVIDANGSISADYLLLPNDGTVVNFEATFYYGTEKINSYVFANIPIEVNYQTNIIGNLLTKEGNISITIDDVWGDPEVEVSEGPEAASDLIDKAVSDGETEIELDIWGTSGGTLTLPATDATITVNFLEKQEGDLTITGDDFSGLINIVLPYAENLVVYIPKGSATFDGAAGTITATTAPSTFTALAEADINKIIVGGGNVAIYGSVKQVTRGEGNEDSITVTLYDGAAAPEVDDDIELVVDGGEPEEPQYEEFELISGGDFESGLGSQVTNNWSSSTVSLSAAGGGSDGVGHSYVISNSVVRNPTYLAQFAFTLNSDLVAGDVLRVSFDARSDNGSNIEGMGMGISYDPWHVETVYLPSGSCDLATSTEWKNIEYEIEITEANSITEKLTFTVGATVDNFYLDNVSVIRVCSGTGETTQNEIVDPNSAGVDFVKGMGVGWNLGNTLDGLTGETYWNKVLASQAMIDVVAKQGFGTLRVPITWYSHLSEDGTYTIDESWLDRVEEVVNYGPNNNMYVIINTHHDEDIISPTTAKLDESKEALVAIWTQVAERFKGYDDKLIFETLNEMRVEGSANEWSGGTAEERDCLNQLHAVAVAAIRAGAGDYNKTRKIMLSTYAASNATAAMTGLELPEGDENLIVSIHAYSPYDFCMNMEDGADTDWGTDYDKTQLDNTLYAIYEQFVAKGIPVILGEWGTIQYRDDSYRTAHAEYYAQRARDHFMCPVVWDDNGWFQLLDRSTLSWAFPNVVNAIVKAAN